MSNVTESIEVPKGDYGFNLNFTLKDNDGNARDMTGYSAKLKVWSPGVPGTLIVDASCSWTEIASGTCYYTVQSEDFDTVGRYLYEIEATKAGVVESAQSGWLTVKESG